MKNKKKKKKKKKIDNNKFTGKKSGEGLDPLSPAASSGPIWGMRGNDQQEQRNEEMRNGEKERGNENAANKDYSMSKRGAVRGKKVVQTEG